ncbi:MAG: efflux RND transporter periplasmic adaptor subunit [Deltaproteobacteria bacterium]|nr:efflux RND transporter periplasmic adaptor subunit [Deltaproteobacteria bacterium]
MNKATGLAKIGLVACMMTLAAACEPVSEATSGVVPPAGEAWLVPQRAQEAGIMTTNVSNTEVGRELLTSGRVTFDDERVSHVFSPVTGRVTRIVAQLGQRVAVGDALAVISSPDLGNAFSDLVKAEADLSAAEREYHRQHELFDAHAGAQRDLDAAEAAFRKAQAEHQRAKEKAHLLEADAPDRVTQEFVLRAPIAGEVIARNVNPGVEVQGQYGGSSAAELYTVGELDRVWVLADVYEIDLPRVRIGSAVNVRVIAFPDRRFGGRVDWIADAIDPTSRTVKVRCVIDNPDHELKPEMYATVGVLVPGQQALTIPRSALLRVGDQTIVFVRGEEAPDGRWRFERRSITVSDEGNNDAVAVMSGLSSGEQVVTLGSILLLGMV